jgi:hypothetical protein
MTRIKALRRSIVKDIEIYPGAIVTSEATTAKSVLSKLGGAMAFKLTLATGEEIHVSAEDHQRIKGDSQHHGRKK